MCPFEYVDIVVNMYSRGLSSGYIGAVATHEVGHNLGLYHVKEEGTVYLENILEVGTALFLCVCIFCDVTNIKLKNKQKIIQMHAVGYV